jgi:hypothetical protein
MRVAAVAAVVLVAATTEITSEGTPEITSLRFMRMALPVFGIQNS